MNGRNHLTLTSIVDALVFAAAIGGLAIVVSVGFISQHAGGPAPIAASSANRIDGHAVTLTRSQERTAPTSSAMTPSNCTKAMTASDAFGPRDANRVASVARADR